MAAVKRTTEKPSAVAELADIVKRKAAFREKHQDVIETWEEIQAAEDSAIVKVKDEARKMSKVGETISLADNALLSVSVFGAVERNYDIERLRQYYPEIAATAIETVVRKTVLTNWLKTGAVRESDLVKKQVMEVTAATPVVTVKVNV